MELYRGMSTIEFDQWRLTSVIPYPRNFTTSPKEAFTLGRKHVRKGSLFVLAVEYDDLLFQQTLPAKESDIGGAWFENTSPINLDGIIYSVLRPKDTKHRINP